MAESRRMNQSERKALDLKISHLESRNIADGRIVDVSSFPDEVIQPFLQIGWNSFIEQVGPVYDHHIRKFYASFKFDEKNSIVTFSASTRVYTIPLETFGIHLGIPTQGHCFYTIGQHLQNLPNFIPREDVIELICENPENIRDKVYSTNLKHPHDLRYKIIDWNIFCREGNHNEVPASLVGILWCLDHQIPVNMAYFVAKRMTGLLSNTKRSLPYGMLLNNILGSLEVALGPPRRIEHKPLGTLTLTRMGKQPSKRAREDSDSDEEEEEEEEERTYHGGDGSSGVGQASSSGIQAGGDDLPEYDPSDPFYALPADEQMKIVYRQQKGIMKLLKDILRAVTCSKK